MFKFDFKSLISLFELSRAGAGNNLLAMEGMRGLAILLVFFAHYVTAFEPYTKTYSTFQFFANQIHHFGTTGVDLFFILSGYLIYGTLISKPIRFFYFMKRRIQRLYPTFSVVFAIYLLLSILVPSQSKLPENSLEKVFFVVANFFMLPPILPMKNLITVSWSLSYEMFFYIITPISIVLFQLKQLNVNIRIGIYLALALFLIIVSIEHIRMVMFFGGMIIYELIKTRPKINCPNSVIIICCFASLLFLIPDRFSAAGRSIQSLILFVTFTILVLAGLQNRISLFTRILIWSPFRWLGNMSYSFYLIHVLAIKIFVIALGIIIKPTGSEVWIFFVALIPCFAIAVASSAMLFLGIERPYSLMQKSSAS
jgi:exopolysaccharide production protein ExoZ